MRSLALRCVALRVERGFALHRPTPSGERSRQLYNQLIVVIVCASSDVVDSWVEWPAVISDVPTQIRIDVVG